jgi:N-alpha-acetyltransferase 15/16, NatA auxiliary subunit
MTWHILGLIHRSQQSYADAAKCYMQALRFSPDNNNIRRDTGYLQIQTRDLKGFCASYLHMLTSGDSTRVHWFGFAVAHFMSGNFELVQQILAQYEATLKPLKEPEVSGSASGKEREKEKAKAKRFKADAYQRRTERNEIVLFRCAVFERMEQYERALEVLEEGWDSITDIDTAVESRARLMLRLGRFEESLPLWHWLLSVNPENYAYHRGLQGSLLRCSGGVAVNGSGSGTELPCTVQQQQSGSGSGGDGEVRGGDVASTLLPVYEALLAAQPRCHAHKLVRLMFLPPEHPVFLQALREYLLRAVSRGVPSSMENIAELYASPAKGDAVGGVLEAILGDVRSGGSRSPAAEMWGMCMLSGHKLQVGDVEGALELAVAGIEHTPTQIELYVAKSAAEKALGQLGAAADTLVFARKLDLADRWINVHATKALIEAGRMEEASETVALFARPSCGEAILNIVEMQNTWFEIAVADAYAAAGNLGMALKRYDDVHRQFLQYVEDQFDFHGYCIRRAALTSYTGLLKWEDRLFRNEYFVRAVAGLARCYLTLHEKPELRVQDGVRQYSDAELKAMPSSRRKRVKAAMRKARKAAAAAEAAKEAERAAIVAEAKKKGGSSVTPVKFDDDSLGEGYLKVEAPLVKAAWYVQQWVSAAPDSVAAHAVAARVAVASDKPLLAVRAVVAVTRCAVASGRGVDEVLAEVEPTVAVVVAAAEAGVWIAPIGGDGSSTHSAVALGVAMEQLTTSQSALRGLSS